MDKNLHSKRDQSTFRHLSELLTVVSSNYFIALKALHDSLEPKDLMKRAYETVSLKGCDIYNSYVARVESAFRKLDPTSQKIINNDYFFNEYKYWNVEYFSNSTYYRLKRKAIIQFLSYFEI